MAQRIIHYLFADIISKQIEINDKSRFLLGSVMPDAYAEPCYRDITHFKIKVENERYFDFNAFRMQYIDLIYKDELYLGYYLHLVVDAFFRKFIYNGQFKMPCNNEEVRILYSDYQILNSYIVNKYNLKNGFKSNVNLINELICQLAPFDIDKFIEEMSYDFFDKKNGKTSFLNKEMVDKFIYEYIPLAIDEIKSIKNGKTILKVYDYIWTR